MPSIHNSNQLLSRICFIDCITVEPSGVNVQNMAHSA